MNPVERFMKYVRYNTQSKERSDSYPSTPEQLVFGQMLVEDLKQIGVANAHQDAHGYVIGSIPSNVDQEVPAVGFVAHMDTAPDFSGENIQPRLIENYDGKDIVLNEENHIVLSPEDYPSLKNKVGKSLIVTDGMTLLGGDDKAGIAAIFGMAENLISHPEIRHGKICIAFTPDEEVGTGVEYFDVPAFGAEFAYTVDGGAVGGIEYETFNAAAAMITVHGVSSHPGSAKGTMKSAVEIGMEFHHMLPENERPQYTEGYEGFYHLTHMTGSVEDARLFYIVRDHDRAKFEAKKQLMEQAAAFINAKYGEGTLELVLKDTYYNMREQIEPHMEIVDNACAVMREMGITPEIEAVRGGTDGSRLSYMGLPCPNVFTGGYNCHGRYEYVCVEELLQSAEFLTRLAAAYAK